MDLIMGNKAMEKKKNASRMQNAGWRENIEQILKADWPGGLGEGGGDWLGFTWTHLNSLELTRTHLNSLELTRTH